MFFLPGACVTYFWFKQGPEPFGEFLQVLCLNVYVAGASDLGYEAFAAEQGFF